MRCLKPLQISVMSTRQEAVCLVGFWGAALLPSLLRLTLQFTLTLPHYSFNPQTVRCVLGLSGAWQTYDFIAKSSAFSMIALCNLGLLGLSLNRADNKLLAGRMRKMKLQAFLITGGISAIFVLSWLPAVVESALRWMRVVVPVWLQYATHLYIVNTFSNPILYITVHRGFSKFLHLKLLLAKQWVRRLLLVLLKSVKRDS